MKKSVDLLSGTKNGKCRLLARFRSSWRLKGRENTKKERRMHCVHRKERKERIRKKRKTPFVDLFPTQLVFVARKGKTLERRNPERGMDFHHLPFLCN